MNKGKTTMEKLTDFNYKIGKFVTSPGLAIGMLGGMFGETHTYIMLANGYVARRPLEWCHYVPAPVDPDCAFPVGSAVIVSSGRLQGMMGTVTGSLEERVFMQARHGSHPTNPFALYGIEMLVFVEDEDFLIPWRSFSNSPNPYQDGYYLPMQSRS